MLATIPPEINAGWFEDVALWAGFTWYHLLLYGVLALLAGVLGDFLIGKGWCKISGYCVFLILMACLGLYFLSANAIYRSAIRLQVSVEPERVYFMISALLWIIGMMVLHRRVVRQS